MSGNITNEGEEYKILDCSDKPVRIFSTLIEYLVTKSLARTRRKDISPLCSRCRKCCNVWFHDFFIKIWGFMDDDLFLLGVLDQRFKLGQVLDEVTIQYK